MAGERDTSTLAGALAYLRPDPASNGSLSLRAPKAREAVKTIEAEIDALRSQDREDGLAAFARELIGYAFDDQDADGGSIQALALAHGLLNKTTYDPERHGPGMEAGPGDEWYELAEPLAALTPTLPSQDERSSVEGSRG